MLVNFPQVEFAIYPAVIHIHHMTPIQIEQQAQAISATLQSLSPSTSFRVNLRLLEYCNTRFSEKQVKRIDENFHDYSFGTRFRLRQPPQNPPRRLRYLIEKFFSGDVSGDIGEALFAYFLMSVMNLTSSQIGHTRPVKRRGYLTPDFVVWDSSRRLASVLQKSNYRLPLLAEVKAFTGLIDPARIAHGLAQLQMAIANSTLIGLLFLVVRNEQRQGYDVYLVRMER